MSALLSETGDVLVCAHCQTVEPNTFLLDNNHGSDPSRCVAQRLIRSQLKYAVRQGRDVTFDVERAHRVGLDPEAIIKDAIAELPLLCVVCRHNRKSHGDFCWSHREEIAS